MLVVCANTAWGPLSVLIDITGMEPVCFFTNRLIVSTADTVEAGSRVLLQRTGC
jgi:hypothetical protein